MMLHSNGSRWTIRIPGTRTFINAHLETSAMQGQIAAKMTQIKRHPATGRRQTPRWTSSSVDLEHLLWKLLQGRHDPPQLRKG
jgi:hypothetical protein